MNRKEFLKVGMGALAASCLPVKANTIEPWNEFKARMVEKFKEFIRVNRKDNQLISGEKAAEQMNNWLLESHAKDIYGLYTCQVIGMTTEYWDCSMIGKKHIKYHPEEKWIFDAYEKNISDDSIIEFECIDEWLLKDECKPCDGIWARNGWYKGRNYQG